MSQYPGYGYPQGQPTGQPQNHHPQGYQQPPPGIDPQIYSWFVTVDTDRSGKINCKELQLALINGNSSRFSDEACRTMINLFDRDQNGTIDVNEFQQLFNFINQWRSSFQAFDKDRTGYIDDKELEQVIAQMGYRLSSKFYKDAVSRLKTPGSKGLALDSFIVFCVNLRQMTDAFRARDKDMSGKIKIGYEDFLGVALLNRS